MCFPELALTAYTCGDLFRDEALLSAAERGLARLMEETQNLDILCAVGLPVPWEGALYNCAAVFHKGKLLGLPAKARIPNYSEFYEARHFTPAPKAVQVDFAGQRVWLGKGLLFCCENVPGLKVGVEICEDLWSPLPPSVSLACNGATLVLNPSCSDETIGKAEYRRELVRQHSGRLLCAYVYTDSGLGESTTDMVFAGHDLIAENGSLLEESQLFTTGLLSAEVDLERLSQERRRMNTWQPAFDQDVVRVPFRYEEGTLAAFVPQRDFARTPFVPQDAVGLSDRCQRILTMQSVGLATRLEHIHCKTAVVGLSGGLDSTLALLVTARAFDRLGLDRRGIHAVSMPCFGTTSRTKSNAQRIAEELGVDFREVSIERAVRQHFLDIGQEETSLDVTYENSQARERTQVLMDIANRLGGIVIGTGDLRSWLWAGPPTTGITCPCMGSTLPFPRPWCATWCAMWPTTASPGFRRLCWTCWTPPFPRSCCPPRMGRSPKRRRSWWGPTSSTISSCTTCCGSALGRGRSTAWPAAPLPESTTAPR